MEYCTETNSIETFLRYPEERDSRNFATQQLQNDFIENVKKFAFPFMKNISSSQPSSLVQFYTFVFTDANRIRQYGFCRSSLNGRHILCLISYLPWYNVFINLLNRITTIINENEVSLICAQFHVNWLLYWLFLVLDSTVVQLLGSVVRIQLARAGQLRSHTFS